MKEVSNKLNKNLISIGIIIILIFSIIIFVNFQDQNHKNYDYLEKPNTNINGLIVDDYLYLLDYEQFSSRNDVLLQIEESKFDLIILDTFYSDKSPWLNSEIYSLKNSTGGDKIIISYLSIGEAEDYRYYWNNDWIENPPNWLDEENEEWEGNYKVKYWDPEWQKIIFDYIENKTVDAGFDGIFLDIIDGYYYYEDKGIENAEELMVDFVCNISQFCHQDLNRENFLIVPQNGESLGHYSRYLDSISGLAKEDIFYNDDSINSKDERDSVLEEVNLFLENDKFVLITDYCRKTVNIEIFYTVAYLNGLIPYATTRDLNEIIINPNFEPD